MADKKDAPEQEQEIEQVEGEVVEQEAGDKPATEPEGIRARRAFMLKQFIPSPDWINMNVVAKGKGTNVKVGRIFGVATGWEEKHNTLPDGTPSISIVLKGMFQAESYMDGEVSEASNVYFPMAFAEKVAALFKTDDAVKTVQIDTDIALEATGKPIPYEWVVSSFIDGDEMNVMKRLRNSRATPNRPAALAAPVTAQSLTDQSGGATA